MIFETALIAVVLSVPTVALVSLLRRRKRRGGFISRGPDVRCQRNSTEAVTR